MALNLRYALIAMLFVAVACHSEGELALSRPACSWALWAGNPGKSAITRNEELEPIQCNDSKFSSYVCMTGEDLKNLLECGGK